MSENVTGRGQIVVKLCGECQLHPKDILILPLEGQEEMGAYGAGEDTAGKGRHPFKCAGGKTAPGGYGRLSPEERRTV